MSKYFPAPLQSSRLWDVLLDAHLLTSNRFAGFAAAMEAGKWDFAHSNLGGDGRLVDFSFE